MRTESIDAAPQEESRSEPETIEVRVKRRRFTAEYKRRILSEAAACKHGELGLLLRREGLYSSTLDTWRKQRDKGGQEALTPKKRGPRPASSKAENIRLQSANSRLQEKLRQAELIIEVQKKLCMMLGLPEGEGAN